MKETQETQDKKTPQLLIVIVDDKEKLIEKKLAPLHLGYKVVFIHYENINNHIGYFLIFGKKADIIIFNNSTLAEELYSIKEDGSFIFYTDSKKFNFQDVVKVLNPDF